MTAQLTANVEGGQGQSEIINYIKIFTMYFNIVFPFLNQHTSLIRRTLRWSFEHFNRYSSGVFLSYFELCTAFGNSLVHA